MTTVNIEGTDHDWAENHITAPDIRRLSGIPDGTEILEVNVEDNTERTLREDEKVELREGKEFGKKVKFRRG